ncbi:leucine rich repeat protein, partial [Gregarina niphandrodes]
MDWSGGAQRLTASILDEELGSQWRESPTTLDFSGKAFSLTSLIDLTSAVLGNPNEISEHLKTENLQELNVARNRIEDVGDTFTRGVAQIAFPRLGSLNLSGNMLTSVAVEIPGLYSLDVSHNHLSRVPSLDGLPSLRTLRLKANHIDSFHPGDMSSIPHAALTQLDLSRNEISIQPSGLVTIAEALHRTFPALADLRLAKNPVVKGFPEYQAFVLRAIPTLTVLDELERRDDTWYKDGEKWVDSEEIEEFDLHEGGYLQGGWISLWGAGYYDQYYQKRLLQGYSDDVAEESMVTLMYEESRDLSEYLLQYLKDVGLSVSDRSSAMDPSEFTGDMRGVLKEVELFCLAEQPALVVKGLVKLMTVPDYAADVSATLRALCDLSVQSARLVSASVSEIALPLLDELEDPNYLLEALVPLASEDWLAFSLSRERKFEPRLVDVYDAARCYSGALELVNTFLLHLRINSVCTRANVRSAERFYGLRFHVDFLFPWLRESLATTATGDLGPCRAQFLADVIRSAVSLSVKSSGAREELLRSLRLEDVLLRIVHEDVPNVRCLTAALEGLADYLAPLMDSEAAEARETVNYVLAKLFLDDGCARLLALLSEANVANLLPSVAAAAAMDEVWLTRAPRRLPDTPVAPELARFATLRPADLKAVFRAALRLTLTCIRRSQAVEHAAAMFAQFSRSGGPLALLDTCAIPDAGVREHSLECLSLVPLDAFGRRELDKLISLHTRFGDVDGEDLAALRHLEFYFAVWNKVVDDALAPAPHECGRLWVAGYAEPLLAACVSKYRLCIESRAALESAARECQRLRVCANIATLVRKTGYVPRLRGLVAAHAPALAGLLRAEDHTSLLARPTLLERCWAGRDLDVLAETLLGGPRLPLAKKMAFRVLARMADVAQGAKDELLPDCSLQELCAAALAPWPRAAPDAALFLDGEEARLRTESMLRFVGHGGLARVHGYVAQLATALSSQQLREERRLQLHVEYWGGRLKGQLVDLAALQARDAAAYRRGLAALGEFPEIPRSTDPLRLVEQLPRESVAAETPPNVSRRRFAGKWVVCHWLQRFHAARAAGLRREEPVRAVQRVNPSVIANEAKAELRRAYAVHEFLRLLQGLLTLAPAPAVAQAV